jgi:hypothetical protein
MALNRVKGKNNSGALVRFSAQLGRNLKKYQWIHHSDKPFIVAISDLIRDIELIRRVE